MMLFWKKIKKHQLSIIMNETLNSLCWNDRLDFVKQLDKLEFRIERKENIVDRVLCKGSNKCLFYNAFRHVIQSATRNKLWQKIIKT